MDDNQNKLSQIETVEIKEDIKKLPKSFNNPEKAQPTPVVQKPISTQLKGERAKFQSEADKKAKLIDPQPILDKTAPRIEKLSRRTKNKAVLKAILGYARPHWMYFLLSMLFALANSVCELLVPIFSGQAIDCLVGKGEVDFAGLKKYVVCLLISAVCYAIFKWLTNFFEDILSYRTDKSIRDALFSKFNRVPIKYIDGSSHGDLQSRLINDVDNITTGFCEGLTTGFDALLSIIFVVAYMFKVNVTIAGVVVGLTPVSLLMTAFIVYRSDKYFRKQAKSLGDLSGHVVEMLGNQKVVLAFNYQDASMKKFEKLNSDLAVQSEKATFYSTMTGPCSRFINGIIYAIVAIMGCVYALNGVMTVGSISVLLSYANKYIRPFNDVSDIISDLQTAFASARRVQNVMNIENEPSDENCTTLSVCDGSVQFENVDFSYTDTKKLIQNLNVTVKPGQKVAIVGPTGCGKSTMINLLMRFYDVNSGDIKMSGKSIYELTRSSMRSKYGMVLQDTWLFNSTIRDNIAYGKPDATMDEVVKAAKRAHVHDFIQTLPDGYNTLITESGDNLSQGQKQLLCIARIMLTEPPMLILDEATSNIDTRTEMFIQDAFNEMMQNRTSFIVAHRLSTIVNSDLILVMNKGNIIEQGTHTQLLEKKGFYYALYNSQFSAT